MVTMTPPRFHVMPKPTGAICNLDCSYSFFLDKEVLYPDSDFRMNDAVLSNYIRQTIEGHVVSHGRYVAFQLAEVAIPRKLFAAIMERIAALRAPPMATAR